MSQIALKQEKWWGYLKESTESLYRLEKKNKNLEVF